MLISIVIPTLDEEEFVGACLESVLALELPPDVSMEVLVLDGGSSDRTRAVIEPFGRRDTRLKLIDNPGRTQSSGLNIGIRLSRGDYVMRLDAHSVYPPDYLARCLETARRTRADNVGGTVVTRAMAPGYSGELVQAITTHPFGTGGAAFRRTSKEGPTDTVPYGFFPRRLFDTVGLFDERLVRAQDYELNRRIIANGGRVWLNPAIRVFYSQRAGFWGFLWKQLTREGPYNAYMWYIAPYAFALRHVITGFFVLGLLTGLLLSPVLPVVRGIFLGVLSLYLVLAVAGGVAQAVRTRRLLHAVALPPAFFLLHVAHGLGVLGGAVRLLTRTAPVLRNTEPGRARAPAAHPYEA